MDITIKMDNLYSTFKEFKEFNPTGKITNPFQIRANRASTNVFVFA